MWCQQDLFKRAEIPVCVCSCHQAQGWQLTLLSSFLKCELQGFCRTRVCPICFLAGCWWCWAVWGAELRLAKPTSHKGIKLLPKAVLLAQAEEEAVLSVEAIFQLQGEVCVSTKDFTKIHSRSICFMSQVFIWGIKFFFTLLLPGPSSGKFMSQCLRENCSDRGRSNVCTLIFQEIFPWGVTGKRSEGKTGQKGREQALNTSKGILLCHPVLSAF